MAPPLTVPLDRLALQAIWRSSRPLGTAEAPRQNDNFGSSVAWVGFMG